MICGRSMDFTTQVTSEAFTVMWLWLWEARKLQFALMGLGSAGAEGF